MSAYAIETTMMPKPKVRITGMKLAVVCILVTELCERLTYYSVVANMVLYCTSKLKYTSDDASFVTLIFSGKYFVCFFWYTIVVYNDLIRFNNNDLLLLETSAWTCSGTNDVHTTYLVNVNSACYCPYRTYRCRSSLRTLILP